MNIDIIEPSTRLKTPFAHGTGSKISSLLQTSEQLFIGSTRGDLLLYDWSSSEQPKQVVSERAFSIRSTQNATVKSSSSRSLRSFRSFQDTRHLFGENHGYALQNTFKNLTQDNSSITTIKLLPIRFGSVEKRIVLIISPVALKIYEIVGSHVNLIFNLNEPRCTATLYLEHDEKRLFFVGVKRKVLVYHIRNKSRNVLEFNMTKEMQLKDRVRTINVYNENNIIVGVESDYFMINLATHKMSTFASSDDADISSQGASFKYFGLSATGPSLWTLATGKKSGSGSSSSSSSMMMILIRDTTVIQLNKNNDDKISASPVKLTTVPLVVLFISPMYLAVVYPKSIEILDLHKGDLIQKFSHYINSNQIFAQVEDGVLSVASGSDVFQFTIVALQKQIAQYLNITGKAHSGNARDPSNDLKLIGLEKAINLVSDLEPSPDNELFTSGKLKQLRLRELYTIKAVSLFDSYSKYHESLVDIASEWLISYHDVLSLFPNFLNAELLLYPKTYKIYEDDNSNKTPPPNNIVKKVTKEDLESNPISESEYETDATRKPAPVPVSVKNTAKSQNIRRFIKAVNNLIIYLTEQRRILSSFQDKSSINWKNVTLEPMDIYPPVDHQLDVVSTTIDTSLFLCYFYVRPMLLGPLLRLPNNRCNSKIVNECLMSNIHNHTQQRRLKQPNYIKELLDFYYGRTLHREALKMLYDLAHEEEDVTVKHNNEEDNLYDDFVRGPGLTVRYLSKLSNDNLDLILDYADWVIDADVGNSRALFMNDSYECESLDNSMVLQYLNKKNVELAIEYLEWLLFKSDLIEKFKKSKQFGRYETRLCLLYLEQIKADSAQSHQYYDSLRELLSSSDTFDPWPVLREIPTTEDKFLRLTVFVFRKLQEHEKAIDVLYNQLNDLDEAIEYCLNIYYQPNGITTGRSLFHKLLEDLLINCSRNIDEISKLLQSQGHKMSVEYVVKLIPASFPLAKLQGFLKNTVVELSNKKKDSQLNSQLYKVGVRRMKRV